MELGGSAVLVDVVLVEGTDKQAFVDSFDENNAEWWNMLPSFPTLLVMLVEENYIETLNGDSRVVSATKVMESFPCTLPSKESMSKRFTSSISSSNMAASGNGEDNSGLQFYLDTRQIAATDSNGNFEKIGREVGTTNGDDAYYVDGTYSSRWTGKHVDIVTLESGSSGDWSTHAGLHDTHPDWQKLSSEDDSHERTSPYWYQCTIHSGMKNTITVNAADGTRRSYTLSVTGGSSYTISGSDRNGTVSGSNPALVFQEGDTVTFNVNASGHPFEIRLADGGSAVNDGSVTNQGATSGAVVWSLRTSSRFTPTDWPNLDNAVNNQVSTNSGLTNHAIGVLSVSGGTICGFAKKANLHALYLTAEDSVTEGIQAVIDWHNAKSNNPETGEKNPTILIAEYQYLQDRRYGIPVDYVDSIVTPNGTVNRPSGGSWGTDLSAFVDANIIPFRVYDSTNGTRWCVVMPFQYASTFIHTALETAWSNGIVCVNAAGNNAGTYTKRQNKSDTYVTIDQATPYTITSISWNNPTSSTTDSTTTWYPHITYGPHGTNTTIDVAAGYQSEAMPGWDGYTTRGPGITVTGLGANTYSSYQSFTFGSYKWGMFSGTSCATPTVVGKIACLMEHYRHYHGSWPSPDTTKQLLLSSAKNVVRSVPSGGTSFSWTSVPSSTMSNSISSGNCYISHGGSGNGGFSYSEAAGTTGLRAFFDEPDFDGHKTKNKGRRPAKGATYPRTFNSVGRENATFPELNV